MRIIITILLLIISLIQMRYRFNHPEMTETQLLFNFFEAFKG